MEYSNISIGESILLLKLSYVAYMDDCLACCNGIARSQKYEEVVNLDANNVSTTTIDAYAVIASNFAKTGDYVAGSQHYNSVTKIDFSEVKVTETVKPSKRI